MEDLGFKIEVEWLRIEHRQSRLEDSIIQHQHLIPILFFVLCRESLHFEDIVQFLIFLHKILKSQNLTKYFEILTQFSSQIKLIYISEYILTKLQGQIRKEPLN